MDPTDEKDALWDLLGKSPRQKASPYFVRKVLRAVREEQKSRPHLTVAALLRWLVPTSALAAVVIFVSSTYYQKHQQSIAQFNEDFDKAADLESLVAYKDVSSWIAAGN